MGICTSCLRGGQRGVYEEDEESRLLFDDPHGAHYGSFGEPTLSGPDDAHEVQREFETLQRIVARTSDNMVDVFEIAPASTNPQVVQTPYSLGIPNHRLARYQNLLSKLSSAEQADTDARIEDYPEIENTVEMQGGALLLKADASGPFVGNFVDAANTAT